MSTYPHKHHLHNMMLNPFILSFSSPWFLSLPPQHPHHPSSTITVPYLHGHNQFPLYQTSPLPFKTSTSKMPLIVCTHIPPEHHVYVHSHTSSTFFLLSSYPSIFSSTSHLSYCYHSHPLILSQLPRCPCSAPRHPHILTSITPLAVSLAPLYRTNTKHIH